MKKQTFLKKANNIARSAGKKVVSKTASVISSPSRAVSALKSKRAESDYKVLKLEKQYKGMPNRNLDGSVTEGFKARTMADAVRSRRTKKK
jgi:hypothetical protein